jgi:hypothetical protein
MDRVDVLDLVAVQAALRIPEQRRPVPSLDEALQTYEFAVRRLAVAQAEASIARRPSTLRATLKADTDMTRARTQLLAELRALGLLPVNEAALRE